MIDPLPSLHLSRWLLLASVACLTAGGGCHCGRHSAWFEDVKMLEVSARDVERLRVETTSGSIRVDASQPSLTSIVVLATVRTAGSSTAEAEAAFEAVELATVRADDDPGVLAVEWRWPSAWRGSRWAEVEFSIQVPPGIDVDLNSKNAALTLTGDVRNASLTTRNGAIRVESGPAAGATSLVASTHNGRIDACTPASSVDLRTSNGAIAADLLNPASVGGVIESHNGAVHVGLMPGVALHLGASTRNGRIYQQLEAVDAVSSRTGQHEVFNKILGRRQFEIELGSGGDELQIKTSNGAIHLRTVPPDAMGLAD